MVEVLHVLASTPLLALLVVLLLALCVMFAARLHVALMDSFMRDVQASKAYQRRVEYRARELVSQGWPDRAGSAS